MKQFISCIVFFFYFGWVIAQSTELDKPKTEHHSFFEESSFTLGFGTEYSLELEAIGLNLRGYYNVGEHICIGPEFSYFNNDNVELFDVNIVGHYIFETPLVGIYPLMGINYTKEIVSEKNIEEKEDAFGIVFGGGMHRNFKNITVFVEYSAVQSDLKDQFVTLGLMYTFKKD